MLAPLIVSVAMTALIPQEAQDPAALVPADTIVYFGTQSVRASARAGRSSAMQMILTEPEVKAFLQKPLAAADKSLQEMVKSGGLADSGVTRLSLSEMVGGSEEGPPLGRMYLALTHITLAPAGAENGAFPDVGLVVGMELLNPDDLAMIKALWSQIPMPEESANYGGHDYFVKSEPDKGFGVSLVFLGNTVVASTSDRTLRDTIDRFNGKARAGSGLVDSADYRKLVAAAGSFPADASSMLVRVSPLVDLLKATLSSELASSSELAEMAPKIATVIDGLGLTAVKFAGGISFRDASGKIQSTSLIALDQGATGLIPRCLTASTAVDIERVKGVPGNCLGMSMGSIDALGEVYDFLLSTFQTLDAEHYGEFQGLLTQIMGERDLRNDILANVHGTVLTYSVPGEGFPGTPTSIARIALKSPQDFVAGVKALLSGASAMFSPEAPVTVTESMHETYPFYELDLSRTPAAMFMLQPAFALDGNNLVASLESAKALKSALNGSSGEGSLADNAEFMAFATALAGQGELHGLSYADNAKTFGAVYGQAAGAAQMLAGGLGELPVDLALMPSEQAITKHLGHSFGGTVSADGGATLVSRATQQFQLGDFMPLILTAGVIAATSIGQEGGDSMVPQEVDPMQQVQDDLAQLSAGMTVYKIAQGRYPAAIDDLVKPLPDYPDGCLAKPEAPVDPWGNAYHFRLNEKGKPFLWSSGPDGVDQDGAGDDVTKQR